MWNILGSDTGLMGVKCLNTMPKSSVAVGNSNPTDWTFIPKNHELHGSCVALSGVQPTVPPAIMGLRVQLSIR